MVIAGTGHRPDKLGGYSEKAFRILEDTAKFWLYLHPEVKEVISGMALGWDQALASAAISTNIPVTAAIPCKGQELRWPQDNQDQYNFLLEHVTNKIILSDYYTQWCMQDRNKWMVDNCTHVLAMFDGSKGGTYNCIQYAKKQNKPIINLYEELYSGKR